MDMFNIKSLLSVLEPEDAKQACGQDGFDVIYRLQQICQKENFPRVQAMQKYYNFSLNEDSLNLTHYCKNFKKQSLIAPETVPPGEKISLMKTGNFLHVSSTENARELFSSNHKCPILSYPYKCTPIMRQWKSDGETFDGTLSNDIFKYTQRPEHLQIFIDSFIRRYTADKKFLSIHWRYDEKDWKNEQCKNSGYKLICENFSLLSDSNAIAGFLDKHLEKNQGRELYDFIYIATPPSEMELIRGVQENFEKEGRIKIVTQVQLIEALAKHYESCGEKYDDLRFEILSLAEMEMSVTATTFYLSFGSSWSFNVAVERSVMQKGETKLNTLIFDGLKKQKKL